MAKFVILRPGKFFKYQCNEIKLSILQLLFHSKKAAAVVKRRKFDGDSFALFQKRRNCGLYHFWEVWVEHP